MSKSFGPPTKGLLLTLQELADLKERIAKENAEAEAKKAAEGPTKSDEKKEREAKSALEAAMAATLAEYAAPAPAANANGTSLACKYSRFH